MSEALLCPVGRIRAEPRCHVKANGLQSTGHSRHSEPIACCSQRDLSRSQAHRSSVLSASHCSRLRPGRSLTACQPPLRLAIAQTFCGRIRAEATGLRRAKPTFVGWEQMLLLVPSQYAARDCAHVLLRWRCHPPIMGGRRSHSPDHSHLSGARRSAHQVGFATPSSVASARSSSGHHTPPAQILTCTHAPRRQAGLPQRPRR